MISLYIPIFKTGLAEAQLRFLILLKKMNICKHEGEHSCTLGLDKIQKFEDQPIKTNQAYSREENTHLQNRSI